MHVGMLLRVRTGPRHRSLKEVQQIANSFTEHRSYIEVNLGVNTMLSESERIPMNASRPLVLARIDAGVNLDGMCMLKSCFCFIKFQVFEPQPPARTRHAGHQAIAPRIGEKCLHLSHPATP